MTWPDVAYDALIGACGLAGIWLGYLIARQPDATRRKLRYAIEQRTDAQRVETELREALDDLWGCIGKAGIDALQPSTVVAAQANHALLWHRTQNGLR